MGNYALALCLFFYKYEIIIIITHRYYTWGFFCYPITYKVSLFICFSFFLVNNVAYS